MKRLAVVLALAFAVTLPVAASAKKTPPTLAPMTTATMPVCPAGDPVVWVNTASHVYHAQGTKFFGHTAHGMYACTSQAVAAHAKPAGMRSKSMMTSASPDPAMPATGKKHHKKGAATTGMPMASPTP